MYMSICSLSLGQFENEDWLVSPSFNADMFDDLKLTFWNTRGYVGPELKLYYSPDFVDNPATASWQEITNFDLHNGETFWQWTNSGLIDLSNLSGSDLRLAFKYTSTSDQAAT
jgi:hypothetical protein